MCGVLITFQVRFKEMKRCSLIRIAKNINTFVAEVWLEFLSKNATNVLHPHLYATTTLIHSDSISEKERRFSLFHLSRRLLTEGLTIKLKFRFPMGLSYSYQLLSSG